MSSKQSKQVKFEDVASFYSKLYADDASGNPVLIKEVEDITPYAGKTVYRKTAAKGKNKGKMLYAVSVDDYIPRKRSKVSVSDKIASLKSQGMTDAEILQALQN